ncbi:hypothetical protein [Silvanigrella aquatica]|uniref:Uncharacterized protein n=1 Tax=Silvanigrella aquatica TaxID=1915309 RepID=A0A1L4CY61_9BACT|nr:hypothetical protein [Silvanigrella aquatica]APJ02875.1 hypothetical protein AXG55_02640 [Silvanigrella aquatica]
MSMLFTIDNFILLNLPSDILVYVIVSYWIVAGVLIQTLFFTIDKFMPVGYFSHTIETSMTRRLFYFIAGGAILPMFIAIIPAVFILSIIGNFLQDKVNRKNL